MENIHSEIHYIADEISKFCGEPEQFARYLGVIKRIGKQRAYEIWSEMKNADQGYLYLPADRRPEPIKSRGKLFMWKAKRKEQ
jgi:hypothetical protein